MYSIGQFAMILKVSTKTLRHYDKVGILKPKAVNDENGYRYYEKEQIPRAKKIIELKECGFSLDEIGIMLHRKDSCDEIINKRMFLLMEEMEILKNKIENCNRLLKHEASSAFVGEYMVELIEIDDIDAIKNRCTINLRNMGDAVGKLHEFAARNGLVPCGGHIVRYMDSDFDPDNADVEIYLPVKIRRELSIHFEKVRGGRFAKAEARSITEKGEAHRAVIDYINSKGMKIIGSPMEQYSFSSDKGFIVDILYPVE